jgi:hypothetical protein
LIVQADAMLYRLRQIRKMDTGFRGVSQGRFRLKFVRAGFAGSCEPVNHMTHNVTLATIKWPFAAACRGHRGPVRWLIL